MLQWYVITGGPCSGKTTIVNELSKIGFHTAPEAARSLIDREIANGKFLEEIRGDEADFQEKVLKLKIEIESGTPKNKVVFFDRAIPDSIAYYEILGMESNQLKEFCKERRYRKIFFLEQLPFKKDYARVEDGGVAKKLSNLLLKTYLELDYEVVMTPVMPIEDRVKFVLSHTGFAASRQ